MRYHMGKLGQYKDQKECAGMKYGYFDDKKREYVITRPDTPAPWVNYLGDPGISNTVVTFTFIFFKILSYRLP